MKRLLVPSKAFVRSAKRWTSKHPDQSEELAELLRLMAEDVHHPALKTHKLKGEMAGSWASSGGYDLRVVFQLIRHEGAAAILLEAVGTHDDVY